MGASDSKPESPQSSTAAQHSDTLATVSVEAPKLGTSGKKICCSCPETKAARDDCVIMNGADKCKEIIEAHKKCLRAEGFDIR